MVSCGDQFLRLGQIGFSLLGINFLRFSEITQYPALIIFSFSLSTCNRIHTLKQYYGMPTLCKTSNSLYTVLFLNERGTISDKHDFFVMSCVANLR